MIQVFSDFDGTIVPHDVGNAFFRAFAGEEKARAIVDPYVTGAINARQCLTQECEAIPTMDRATLERFADGYSVDPTFVPFARFCRDNGIGLTVLSDGLDAYVARILARAGLDELPWFANRAEFVVTGGRSVLRPAFPWRDAECEQCGNCKRNHMITRSADEDVLVYIGDGISDRCPVRYADIVFARRSLIGYCQEQNITYHTFRDFADVRARVEPLLKRKRPAHRREAVMARRDAFRQG